MTLNTNVVLAGWSIFKDGGNFIPLPHTRRGIEKLGESLSKALHIDDTSIQYIIDAPRDDVMDAVLDASASSPELLLVYLASHGIPKDNQLFLATEKCGDLGDHYFGLGVDDIKGILERSKAQTKILFVDSCFAGLAGGSMGDNQPPTKIRIPDFSYGGMPRGICIVASCSGQELAWAPIGDHYTIFTEALISVLENATGIGPSYSTDQLVTDANELIAARSSRDEKQHPYARVFDSDGVADRAVFSNPAHPGYQQPGSSSALPFRVLIVDDNAQSLLMLTEVVQETARKNGLDIDIGQASDETDAGVMLASFYDLIIVDLFLSDGPATVLLERIRSESPNSTVIVVTKANKADPLSTVLPDIVRHPPLIDGFLIKHTAHDKLRGITRGAAEARQDAIGRIEGVRDLASRVPERLSSRSIHPLGATEETIESEAIAVVAGLFSPWLNDDTDLSSRERIFSGFRLHSIDGGLSSCLVYLAQPLTVHEDVGLPSLLVVKVGPKSEIRQEVARFKKFVEVGIPLKQRTDLLGYWLGRNLGGLLYSFIGSNQDGLKVEDVRLGAGDNRNSILADLFSPDEMSWYAARGLPTTQLFEYYSSFHFTPDDARGAIDTLNAWTNRMNRQGSSSPRLPSLDGSLLSNEIFSLGWPTTLVHGDLHLGNVVSSGPGHLALIDYRNVGPGPRCIDFVAAELSVATEADTNPEDALESCQRIRDWYLNMDVAGKTGDIDLPPELTSVADDIQRLRLYLAESFPDDPVGEEEYSVCMLLHTLRRSRYRSRTREGQAHLRIVLTAIALACLEKLDLI